MTWDKLALLIIEIGYPMAMKIWQNIQAGGQATQQQWDELEAMTRQTALDRVKAVLTQAGIPLDSPQAIALLEMAK